MTILYRFCLFSSLVVSASAFLPTITTTFASRTLSVQAPLARTLLAPESSRRSLSSLYMVSATHSLTNSSEWYAPSSSSVATASVATTTTSPPSPVNTPSKRHAANTHPLITEINSSEELQAYLQADPERITVIKFHAVWCKSCQKFGLLYHKMAAQHSDWVQKKRLGKSSVEVKETGASRFASIEWAANTEQCRSLGIKKLPTVHFYRGTTKLAGFSAGPKKIQMVKETLQYYQGLSADELDFSSTLQEGSLLVENAVTVTVAATTEPPTTVAAVVSEPAAVTESTTTPSAAANDPNEASSKRWGPW